MPAPEPAKVDYPQVSTLKAVEICMRGVLRLMRHSGPADAHAGEENAYDFSVVQYGKERDLSEFKDQVTVILNIASE